MLAQDFTVLYLLCKLNEWLWISWFLFVFVAKNKTRRCDDAEFTFLPIKRRSVPYSITHRTFMWEVFVVPSAYKPDTFWSAIKWWVSWVD